MTAFILFDTLRFSHSMIQAGMPIKQAEMLAQTQKEIFQSALENGLASKEDIYNIKTDISEVKKEINSLHKDIQILEKKFDGKFNLLYWMSGFLLAFISAVLFKLYF